MVQLPVYFYIFLRDKKYLFFIAVNHFPHDSDLLLLCVVFSLDLRLKTPQCIGFYFCGSCVGTH